METIEIWCPFEGDTSNRGWDNEVLIKIPKYCITHNIKHSVSPDNRFWKEFCRTCSSTYSLIWKHRIIAESNNLQIDQIDGTMCNYCGEYYKYAVPNLPNGELKCYSCRSSYVINKIFIPGRK